MSDNRLSTDADVASPAYVDHDRVEGDHSASSIRAVIINRPRAELYAFWRDFSNLPRFMENVKSVEIIDPLRSKWVIAAPGGATVDLASEITEDLPDEKIAWTSSQGSDIDHEGWIAFKDNAFGRGTEVRVFISYDPPAGAIGKIAAKMLQREPRVQARRELRRFKQLMETGEVSTSKAPDAASRAARHF
jgi:uncharacterized membrane protein